MARKMKDSGIEWIGDIPEGWEVVQLKRFTEVHNGREIEAEVDSTDSSAVGVYGSGGVFKYTNRAQYNGKAVLFGRKGTLGKPLYVEGRLWAVDTMYFLTYSNRLLEKFSYYQFLAFNWAPYITHTAIPSVVASEIVACYFPIPPLEEQKKIADYLDNGCASLDAILDKTRSSIEEYKKLKQAVITQAVTAPNCPNVKLKYLMDIIVDCPHETPIYTFTGNYLVIRTSDQSLASLRCDEDMYRLDEAEYKKRTRRLTLDKDDIVYGREGSWGLACLVPQSNKYCLGQRVMQFRCNTRLLYPKYAMYALISEKVYMQGALDTIGSTAPHVKISTICNYLLPVPALTEQKEIADHLDAKCAEIDRLIAKKEQLVKELESYKKSLIYEVVTGKREV